MMGRTHALTGWCCGAALAPVLGLHSLTGVVVMATATAGYALLPDLDHPGARASRLLGPITGLLCGILRRASAFAYRHTKGRNDERSTGTHRHLTHTIVFALALGAAAAIGSTAGGRWAVAGIAGFGFLLAVDALGDWLLPAGGVGVLAVLHHGGVDDALHQAVGWVGVAITAGCITHCLGDALTKSGCPFLWPAPIGGETWYEIRPPALLRFRTGGAVEHLLIVPAVSIAAFLLLPGAWTQASGLVHIRRGMAAGAVRVTDFAITTERRPGGSSHLSGQLGFGFDRRDLDIANNFRGVDK